MENKKDLNSLKEITQQDWQEIAKILTKEKSKKYKKAFYYLTDKYNVNFTYQNFYSYAKNNELKILRDELTEQFYEEIKEEIDKIKGTLERVVEGVVLLKNCCRECNENYKFFIKFLQDLLKHAKLKEEKREKIENFIKKLQEQVNKKDNTFIKTLAFYVSLPQDLDSLKDQILNFKIKLNNLKQK